VPTARSSLSRKSDRRRSSAADYFTVMDHALKAKQVVVLPRRACARSS
jgi:hypothetical protein